MSDQQKPDRAALTPEQKEQLRKDAEKAESLELNPQELEERISPLKVY
ncbi:MAG TPA: hypothetical protein VFK09_00815 [Gemmatimonadales bacterium]|jgi:hypothetical protein|nr:hypothetical protein [Gemmatimonadales bacterium]